MEVYLLSSILLAFLAQGDAIHCTKCTEMTASDPNFPGTPPCTTEVASCDSGVTSCMETIVTMEFSRDTGPLTLTQRQLSCALPAGLPAGDTCADQDFIDTYTSYLPDPATLFPAELGLTFESLDVSVCVCDSSDHCTPPSPSTGPEPATTTQATAEATTQVPTTPVPTLPVRLFGGSVSTEGTVEIFHDDAWGTICDDSWDVLDATVVCRMLGYYGASSGPRYARFGEGTGPIHLDDVVCSGDETSLEDCQHAGWGVNNCAHYEDAGAICITEEPTTPPPPTIDGIRIVNGNNDLEGRVEILSNGEWGTICDDWWDIDGAAVACRMLGYDGASQAWGNAAFGQGTGPILLDDVRCIGNETSLLDCQHRTFGENNCAHSEDAGVVCTRTEPTTPPPSTTATTPPPPTSPTTPPGPTIDGIRIVNGNSDLEGRVEILSNGEWGTICDDAWDFSDAAVACRMLGYDGASQARGNAAFGQGTGPIYLDDVICVGNETNLLECWHRTFGESNCGHHEDAGVICSVAAPITTPKPPPSCPITDIRLVDGSDEFEGRVEIQYQGEWGTICDDLWSIEDAAVVCRMLGFVGAYQATWLARFGVGSGPIHLDDVECTGDEETLEECLHRRPIGQHNCAHEEDAGVICIAPTTTTLAPTTQPPTLDGIRLSDGSSIYEGRVEVLVGGVWGTVCNDYWGLEDGNVACRMIGFPSAVEAIQESSRFGQGTGPILLDDLRCTGDEESLAECDRREFGEHNCGHVEDAGLVCRSPETTAAPTTQTPPSIDGIRLVNGSGPHEGRVEILYDGEWGTICGNYWSWDEAVVVCRMLGGNAQQAVSTERFGPGTSEPVHVDSVSCSGSEQSLLGCNHGTFGQTSCDHSEDAGVICYAWTIPTTQPAVPTIDDIRLVGGSTANEGRVEVLYQGEWGTVCDDLWSLPDGDVACGMLGFPGAEEVYPLAYFGPGNGPIILDDVVCSGDETNLGDCAHNDYRDHNCQHWEDAGVRCFDEAPTTEPPTTTEVVTTPIPRQVRLVDGNIPSRGRVEVSNEYGHWGTICDYEWTQRDADVVCRMLGYEGASGRSNNGEYGYSSGRVSLDEVVCSGSETNIAQCDLHRYSGWGCDHEEDVGVTCTVPEPSTYDIRLVNGNHPWEGRIEIYYDGAWGTICDNFWGKRDGDVACRMLGYSGAQEAISTTGALFPTPFGQGTGDILVSDFRCTGDEASLDQCSHSAWGDHNCYHYEDAGLRCYSPDPDNVIIRLVDGNSPSEGRVEVLYEGEFGTVCDDGWGISNADVVCKMMGYEGASEATSSASFGQGSGSIVLDNVECDGSETNIAQCLHNPWGENNCAHSEDAGVVCYGDLNIPVRLVNDDTEYPTGDNEGRVEIFRYGDWGTICDDFWDINDGHVVCRMLGYSSATRIWWGTRYGPGNGRILLDTVECGGSETTLDECDSQPWGVSDCSRYEDAGVVCA